ncbi:MAG: type IV pilin protein, partial [Bdellovibrionales bacterium]
MHPLQKGFSLIEMLVTVGIIGTLSVVGISKFKQSERRGKTLEAKVFLSNLYSNERIYWIENGKNYHYDFTELGLDLVGKYTYNVGFSSDGSGAAKNITECPVGVCGDSAVNFNIAEVCGLTFDAKNKECRLVLPGTSADAD